MKPIQDFLNEWLPGYTLSPEPVRTVAKVNVYRASYGTAPVELGYVNIGENMTSDDLVLGLLSGAPFLLYETDEHVLVMSREDVLQALRGMMSAEELLTVLAYWLKQEPHFRVQRPEAIYA